MRRVNVLVVCVTVLIIGFVFWPTMYRYDRLTGGNVSVPMRTNRITGVTQVFWQGDWRTTGSQAASGSAGAEDQRLPATEQALLTGEGSFGYSGRGYQTTGFGVSLYNGSAWIVNRVVLRVSAIEPAGGVRWSRRFSETTSIGPLSTQYLHIELGGDDGAIARWQVEEAYGRQR